MAPRNRFQCNTRPYTLDSARFALLGMSPDMFGASYPTIACTPRIWEVFFFVRGRLICYGVAPDLGAIAVPVW